MANYTYSQLEGLWQQAGGSAALAPTMAAIALAESSGNPNAVGPVGEHGLWQIYGKAWPGMDTFDPLGNARSAVTVQSKQGLSAWSTYTNGAYKAYLANGVAATLPPGASGSPANGSAGGSGVSTALDSTCLIGIPSISGGVLTLGLSSPSICFVSKKMARQIVGGFLVASSLVSGLVALAVIYKQDFHIPFSPGTYLLGQTGKSSSTNTSQTTPQPSSQRSAAGPPRTTRSGTPPSGDRSFQVRRSIARSGKSASFKGSALTAQASLADLPELAAAAV